MSLQEDHVIDSINKPLLGVAVLTVIVGFFLCLTVVLMPLGLPVMLGGGAWVAALYAGAWYRAKHPHTGVGVDAFSHREVPH